jgi:hypothetical protein
MKTINKSFFLAMTTLLFAMLACWTEEEPTPSVVLPEVAPTATQETILPTATPVFADYSECANPYLPVKNGATWNYKISGDETGAFTRSIISTQADGFTDQDSFGSGLVRQGKWQCDNGSLTALDPAGNRSASIVSDGIWVDFQTTAQSGVTLPASINPGDAWSQSLTIEGTQSIYDVKYQARNQLTSNCTAIGIETVTVEAGTFQAMRVDCRTVMNISLTIEDKPNQTTLTIDTTNWLAENVGLVKTVTTGEDLDGTIELVNYNIPQPG